MKFRSLFASGCALTLVGWIACDAMDSTDPEPEDASGRSGTFDRTHEPASGLADVRARADAAFAETTAQARRFETRIGPQPWPEDLPPDWPTPSGGRVVADTQRNAGARLLLVDLPGSPDGALDTYRSALREGGYEVTDAPTGPSHRALRATRGRDEAMLGFFGRERTTRVEILFVTAPRG